MEHNKEVMQCKFNEVDESRLDRWASVGYATWRYSRGLNDPKLMHIMWVMPMDDFMWYLTRRREHKGSQMSRARCSCVHCGASNEHEIGSCIVTTQHGDDEEVCVVYQAEYPPHGNCKAVLEALILANSVHQEDLNSHKVGNFHGVYGGLQSRTPEHIASFCEE